MTRWFSAELEGSYVGIPSAKGSAQGARRHQLQVYRAALRDLRWIDPPQAQKPQVSSDEPVAVSSVSATAIAHIDSNPAAGSAPIPVVGSEGATAGAQRGSHAATTDAPMPDGSESAIADFDSHAAAGKSPVPVVGAEHAVAGAQRGSHAATTDAPTRVGLKSTTAGARLGSQTAAADAPLTGSESAAAGAQLEPRAPTTDLSPVGSESPTTGAQLGPHAPTGDAPLGPQSATAISQLSAHARATGATVPVGSESATALAHFDSHAAATHATVPSGSENATAIAGLGLHAAPVLRQLRIDHAHVTGVRGPGTWYEGPVFDLVIHSFRLTHATEHEGRPYGRIVGSAVGWLELPPEPVQPEVHVSERVVPPPAPLTAAVHRQPTAPASKRGAAAERGATAERDAPAERDMAATEAALRAQSQPEFDGEPDPEAPGETAAPASTPSPFLLPLTLAVIVVGLGLFIACGAGSMGLWALFMLPTLLARRLFAGVLRDSGFLRGFGYACIAMQAFCVSQLVSSAWSSGCPQLSLLPMLGVIAVLFPAGLLPSIIPLTCNAIGLALVLATFGQAPASACRQEPRTELRRPLGLVASIDAPQPSARLAAADEN